MDEHKALKNFTVFFDSRGVASSYAQYTGVRSLIRLRIIILRALADVGYISIVIIIIYTVQVAMYPTHLRLWSGCSR